MIRRWHWVIPAAVTGWAWHQLGEPGGTRDLWAGLAAAVLVWPLAAITVVYGIPASLRALIPREWRARHRYGRPRKAIPARIRRAALARYRHRCVYCQAPGQLQIEHIMPWSRGGLTSLWNCSVLCALHNRIKSDYWVYRSGRACYRPWDGHANEALAADILAAERRARINLLRWLAAAWLLACT
jgi:hypothetical protein